MINISLKLAREKGHASVKVQQLILLPEEKFQNKKKEELYRSCRFYHSKQNGIMKISQYQFTDSIHNQNVLLVKQPIAIRTDTEGFDYAEPQNENERIWYMNYAGLEPFCERDTDSESFEDVQVMKMPLLFKANQFLQTVADVGLTPFTTFFDEGTYRPTPLLFENVPQWADAGRDWLEPLQKDKFNNIIAMRAPFQVHDIYTLEDLTYLVETVSSGFGGIQKQGQKAKKTVTHLHTGNWGCGNLRNNPELIYLAQLYIASVMGFVSITFHKVFRPAFDVAVEKFTVMPDMTVLEFADYLAMQHYRREL